jgi:hypothetical protein
MIKPEAKWYMKIHPTEFAAVLLILWSCHAPASVLYVDLNSTNPVAPYADLSTAAVTIQDAVDAATNGDLVLVNDGVYQVGGRTNQEPGFPRSDGVTNRVLVGKPVAVQGINGPAATFISGSGTDRCVYLTNGASLSGFSLINGLAGWVTTSVSHGHTNVAIHAGNGGGVIGGEFGGGVVSNCVLTGNVATGDGGGACEATLVNCLLTGNQATNGGGAASSALVNCVLTSNRVQASGIILVQPGPTTGEGGGIYLGSAINCVIAENSAYQGGGAAGLVTLKNCTTINNSASLDGGAFLDSAAPYAYSQITNCIIYYNSAGTNANFNLGNYYIDHSCSLPSPGSGVGNITNAPAFVDFTGGDYHLQASSLCINSGNNSAVTTSTDADGNPRIAGGTVDIGAYEFQTPSSMLSYAWAQQYGFPTDGSADFADPDGDGMNNWQELVAGTNPTNATSVLAMVAAYPVSNFNWVIVKWQSVNTRNYYLLRSSNLSSPSVFSLVSSNITGQAGTTMVIDATATNSGPYFYRVGVQ